MEIYISIIQVCLFILTALVVFCEMTPVWADTFKSAVLRLSIGTLLIIGGYYTRYLFDAPYITTFTLLGIVLLFTVFTFKYIICEHYKRTIKLTNINRKINQRHKRCLF